MNPKATYGYVEISNVVILDPNISIEAKGLLLYILSKPDGWNFCAYRMASELGCGERHIKSARKELINAGFLRMEKNFSSGTVLYFLSLPSVRNAPERNAPERNAPERNAPIYKRNSKDNKYISKYIDKGEIKNFGKEKKEYREKVRKNFAIIESLSNEMNKEKEKEEKLRIAKENVSNWIKENTIEWENIKSKAKRELQNNNPEWSSNTLNKMIIPKARSIVAKNLQ